MNEHTRPNRQHFAQRPLRPTTMAADGLPRLRWTTAELLAMVEAGILGEDEKLELLGGDIVPMAAKGRRHEMVAEELGQFWHPRAPVDVKISIERQFNLSADTYFDPDLVVRPAGIKTYDLRGPEALLVVEVADSSLTYDNGAKARVYAHFGVREYWVINAVTHETTVHRGPTPEAGYTSRVPIPPDQLLTPLLVPALEVRLADLDLG